MSFTKKVGYADLSSMSDGAEVMDLDGDMWTKKDCVWNCSDGTKEYTSHWLSELSPVKLATAMDMKSELEKLGYTVTEPHREDGWYQLTDGGFSHVRYSDDNVWYREVNSAGQGCDGMFPATMHYTSIIYLGPYVEKEE